jgi:xanthine dehydrogenase YagR molybdenum-binding subunit
MPHDVSPFQPSAHIRHGSNIGQPLTRRDGVLKVTGSARYAADNHPAGMLHAVVAVSTIARGRVTFLDVDAARAHPGVVEVITPENRPPLHHDPDERMPLFGFRIEVLQDDRVRYASQPIALVVAETFEAATEAAALLSPRYETLPVRTELDNGERFVPEMLTFGGPARTEYGDIEAGLAAAARRIEADYETPAQYHNAMEPHALVAEWQGDRLILDMPNQAMALTCAGLAAWFGIPPENVLIRSPFLGGGFGSKAIINGPQILGILAARMLGRPVKLVLTRAQMFGPVSHRARTWQRLHLGMDREGKFTAIRHDAIAAT